MEPLVVMIAPVAALTFVGLSVACFIMLFAISARTFLVGGGAGLGIFGLVYVVGLLGDVSWSVASMVGAFDAEVVFLVVCRYMERRMQAQKREQEAIELENRREAAKHRPRTREQMRRYWMED
ncbi:MAG: hypothetical protein ACRDXX_03115 [Stackebrandtia sp.]